MTTDEIIERELLASLSRELDNTAMPQSMRKQQIESARSALRGFYRNRGLYGGATYFLFDDESQQLVPYEPAPSLRVRQDGWGYGG